MTEDVAALTQPSPAALSLRSQRFLIGLAVAGILALGLAFRAGALDLPLDRDEGAYGYIGANLASGTIPYRDAFDHKPPGVYVFYAFASLGPDKVTAVRLATDILFAVSLLLIFTISARIYGRAAGLVAALAWAALGNSFRIEAARANTEQIMVPFLLLAVWSFQKGLGKSSPYWLLASGFASGIALLIKQVAVLPALVLLGFLVLRAISQRNWRRSTVEIGAATAGAAIPVLATVIYFGAAGALDDLYFAVVQYNSMYVRAYWEAGGARLDNFDPILTPWAYAALGFLFSYPFIKRRNGGWGLLIVTWTLANLAGAKMGLRDFPHYFVPVVPGIAILAGAYISSVSERLAALIRGASWLRPALAIGVAMGLFVWQAEEYVDFYFRSTPAEMAKVEFGGEGEHTFACSEEVASYIRTSTQPEDEILVWANEAQVYFLSERQAASRYIYTYPFAFIPDGAATIESDFLTRRPRLVVTYSEDSPMGGPYELLAREEYTQTQQFQSCWLSIYERQ